MVKIEHVRTALCDIGVADVELLDDEKLLEANFCNDLEMDSLDFEDFLYTLSEVSSKRIPPSASDYKLSIGEFISICNAC